MLDRLPGRRTLGEGRVAADSRSRMRLYRSWGQSFWWGGRANTSLFIQNISFKNEDIIIETVCREWTYSHNWVGWRRLSWSNRPPNDVMWMTAGRSPSSQTLFSSFLILSKTLNKVNSSIAGQSLSIKIKNKKICSPVWCGPSYILQLGGCTIKFKIVFELVTVFN